MDRELSEDFVTGERSVSIDFIEEFCYQEYYQSGNWFEVCNGIFSQPQTRQKHRQRFSQKYIPNNWSTRNKKLYIGETERRLRERRQRRNLTVAWHFNLPNHSKQHMAVCGLSLHGTPQNSTIKLKFIFQIGGTLKPHGINERFLFNKFNLLFFTLPSTNL